ncbi:Lrp/AsnC family transcriptional regulator [Vacuolonema iberomarrocanum]|uniref:Lrp/AsnC family transcriptional regulator n=1 Tax=Vacuolonema iberomarrocanum TaxID=3454632 RepID=UPI0019FB7475|nr:Lrp/AsnC family transcriptional regulator [filamentous cyanobacterium LEGE 07170]
MGIDTLDCKIIVQLMSNGRGTWSELATLLQISAPAVAERARRLQERGIIQGYAAQVDPRAVGLTLLAYVAVTLDRPEHRVGFLAWVQQTDAVQECHHIAGDGDYLLKVRCRDTADLEELVSNQLKGLEGIVRSRTTIVLSTVKETSRLPMPADAPERNSAN